MFEIRKCKIQVVRDMVAKYHGYGEMGKYSTYAFAVYEDDVPVAAYSWQPPPPGAAAAVCPEAPYAVLSLSRMVAVPKEMRKLKHISKPLKWQMKVGIDRERWPVLITYSDEGQGHTGYVYQCSGWEKTVRNKRPFYSNLLGKRVSSYNNGERIKMELDGHTHVQRWEHWVCERGEAYSHLRKSGWIRVPVPGKVWRSGNMAYQFVRT